MKSKNDESHHIMEHELPTLTHRKLKRIARGIQRETGCSYISAIKQIAGPLHLEPKALLALAKEEIEPKAIVKENERLIKTEAGKCSEVKENTREIFGMSMKLT